MGLKHTLHRAAITNTRFSAAHITNIKSCDECRYNALLHISAPTAEFISYLNVLCYFLTLIFPLTAYLVQKSSHDSACMILLQLITFVYTTFADTGCREV
jgi:hypothetical protein